MADDGHLRYVLELAAGGFETPLANAVSGLGGFEKASKRAFTAANSAARMTTVEIQRLEKELAATLPKVAAVEVAAKKMAVQTGRAMQLGNNVGGFMAAGGGPRGAAAAGGGFGALAGVARGAGIFAGLGAVAVTAAKFVGASAEARAETEGIERAMSRVGDQTMSVASKMGALRDAAKLPGLGFKEAGKGTLQLQGAGMGFASALGLEKGLANALTSMGGGKEELGRVTTQFQQMLSKGKVLQEDIVIIAESLPNIGQLMEDAFGTRSAEAINKAGISVAQFIAGIREQLDLLPQAQGGIQSSFDNLGDSWFNLKSKVGEFFGPGIATAARGLSDVLDAWSGGGAESQKKALADLAAQQARETDATNKAAAAADAERESREKLAKALEKQAAATKAALSLRGGDGGLAGLNRLRELVAPEAGPDRVSFFQKELENMRAVVGTADELRTKLSDAIGAGAWEKAAALNGQLEEMNRLMGEAGKGRARFDDLPPPPDYSALHQAQADLATDRAKGLSDFAQEMEILAAAVTGDKARTAELQRQKDLHDEIVRLRAQGFTYAEAESMATAKTVAAEQARATAARKEWSDKMTQAKAAASGNPRKIAAAERAAAIEAETDALIAANVPPDEARRMATQLANLQERGARKGAGLRAKPRKKSALESLEDQFSRQSKHGMQNFDDWINSSPSRRSALERAQKEAARQAAKLNPDKAAKGVDAATRKQDKKTDEAKTRDGEKIAALKAIKEKLDNLLVA